MKRSSVLQTGLALVLLLGLTVPSHAQPVIEDITFSSQPGSKFEVRLDFSEVPPADYSAYTIEEPARIAIDFPGTKSGLDQKRFSLPFLYSLAFSQSEFPQTKMIWTKIRSV